MRDKYSEHIKDKENVIVEFFSRSFEMSKDNLTKNLLQFNPKYVVTKTFSDS